MIGSPFSSNVVTIALIAGVALLAVLLLALDDARARERRRVERARRREARARILAVAERARRRR